MGYGSKVENIKEASPLGLGVHEVTLKSLVFETRTPKDPTKPDYMCAEITFEDAKGKYASKLIFNPDGGNDEAKVEKAQETVSNFFTYVVAKVYGRALEAKENQLSDKVNSFADLGKDVTERLLKEDFTGNKLLLKLTGSTYKGNPRIEIPGYAGGWLENVEAVKSGKVDRPEINDLDKKKNNEYKALIANPATKDSSNNTTSGGAEEDDDLPF
jgi:hypothetical protein